MMEAKDFPAEDAALDTLGFLSDGRNGSGGNRNPSNGSEEKEPGHRAAGGEKDEQEARIVPPASLDSMTCADLGADFRSDIPEADLTRGLACLIRALATRTGGEGDSLTLFNQLRGPEGSWVLVPFRFSLDEVDFAGSFRIQLPYVRGGRGRFEGYFTASRGFRGEDWSFFVNFSGSHAPSVRIVAPVGKGGAAASHLASLTEELAAHSCSVELSVAENGAGLSVGRIEGFEFDA
jgi:hypothetical protein